MWICKCCGRWIYPHDIDFKEFELELICPYCGCQDLELTDEDEQ